MQVRNGVIGVYDKRNKFIEMTNFCFKVIGEVTSSSSLQKLKLKGSLFLIEFKNEVKRVLYMPDSKVDRASNFKSLFDAQFLKPKLRIKCSDKQWAELITKEIETFENGEQYKELEFVEYIGLQVHTFKANGKNHCNALYLFPDPETWRWCFGPDLFFKAGGVVDEDPRHFW